MSANHLKFVERNVKIENYACHWAPRVVDGTAIKSSHSDRRVSYTKQISHYFILTVK